MGELRMALPLAPPEIDDEEYLLEQFGKPRAELLDEQKQQWDRELEQIRKLDRIETKLVSPLGAIHGIPPLLDARRVQWKIPDGAFQVAPLYDRIYVYQIPMYIKKKGAIFMSEVKEKAELRTGSRGILVAAGMKALDAIRSNGCDLGHIVRTNHVNPWRMPIDFAEGKEYDLLVMEAGYLTGSEDLADMLRSGAVKTGFNQAGDHVFLDQEGNAWDPVMPWNPNDTI